MTLVLHDNLLSSNAQKVRFLLRELELPFERIDVPFAARPAEHFAANPTGGIPALIDGALVVAESNAILRYLASRERRDDLYPTDVRDRARVDWLLDHQALFFRPQSMTIEIPALGFRPGRGVYAEPIEPEQTNVAFEAALPKLRMTEQLLGTPPWACLERFTIVDVAFAPFLHRLRGTSVDLGVLSRLSALAEAVVSRSVWQAMASETGVAL